MRQSQWILACALVGLLASCEGTEQTAACGDGGRQACACDDGGMGTRECVDGAVGACVCEPAVCETAAECDDGLFCNGAERCAPDDQSADERGCAPSLGPACIDGQTCSEDEGVCRTECPVGPDADGDGHDAIECGGDDCDDSDPARFPGNVEFCDASGHDEDCDPSTIAGLDGDRDGDGHIAVICCNTQDDGGMLCGDDCDDFRSGVHPGASEACNGVDDDCSGEVDDGVEQTFYRDLDGDGFGDIADTVAGCVRPGGYAVMAGDCDETRPSVHPAGADICDGIDNDCDESTDEEPASAGCAAVPGATVGCVSGACAITACDAGFADCNRELADGCERDIRTASDCGSCDHQCHLMCSEGACDDAQEVQAGDGHTCALQMSGRVACWGSNSEGQLGRGPLGGSALTASVAGLEGVVALDVGRSYTCAIRETGEVVCWGRNDEGQLGDGTTTDRHSPTPVPGLSNIVQLSTSVAGWHTCAVRTDGRVFCWGFNINGQLGDGTTTERHTPVQVLGLTDAVQVATGARHSCARRAGGTVACWGQNVFGQLGRTPTAADPTNEPAVVPGLSDVEQISLGANHSCALTTTDEVWCWGSNRLGSTVNGQLGNGDDTLPDSQTPVLVNVPFPAAVTAGGYHTCSRFTQFGVRRVSCWGWNGFGQLGDGSTVGRFAPSSVSLSNASTLSAGDRHTCAVVGDAVFCWGANTTGQLGDGTTADRTTPGRVPAVP